MEQDNNHVELVGSMDQPPLFSHTIHGEDFFLFPLRVCRLSGTEDTVNILVRKTLLEQTVINSMEKIHISGSLRSFNNRSGTGNRLVITVFAQDIRLCSEEDKNDVLLDGALCKPPVLRKTPLGREICDLMLAVNRKYSRSDYLPCIAWGHLARSAAKLEVGRRLQLQGRIQSRNYLKCEENYVLQKTAFEVSVSQILLLKPDSFEK